MKSIPKRIMFFLVIVIAMTTMVSGQSKVITKPITIICSFAAGGGTDQVNRALAEGMKTALGVQVNVVNMPGASGGIAMEYVKNKAHNGLVILGCSETNLFAPAAGAFSQTAKYWDFYWAGGSPGAVMVPVESAYKTFEDLVAAAKANPDKIKVASAGVPGVWSMRWMAIQDVLGFKTKVIPFAGGSAPSVTAVLSGEVDAVHVSIGEVLPFLQSGKLRVLVATEVVSVDIPKVGMVKAIADTYPALKAVLPMPQLLGLAIPADTPQDIKKEITWAFNEAMKSDAVKKILVSQLAEPFGYSGEKANSLAKSLESKFSWLMVDLKVNKKDPAALGIMKP